MLVANILNVVTNEKPEHSFGAERQGRDVKRPHHSRRKNGNKIQVLLFGKVPSSFLGRCFSNQIHLYQNENSIAVISGQICVLFLNEMEEINAYPSGTLHGLAVFHIAPKAFVILRRGWFRAICNGSGG